VVVERHVKIAQFGFYKQCVYMHCSLYAVCGFPSYTCMWLYVAEPGLMVASASFGIGVSSYSVGPLHTQLNATGLVLVTA